MARGNPGLALAAGFGKGFIGEMDRRERQQRDDEDRQMRRDEHDARMRTLNRAEQDRIALADAARPITVQNGATVTGVSAAPTTYDSADVAASDVRQARMLGEHGMPTQQTDAAPAGADVGLAQARMTPASVVQGKAYQDPAAAGAAAAQANTPQARDARIAQTLRERGDVTGAMQYEANSQKLQSSAAELADRQWSRQLRDAMAQGHNGLADMVSKSEAGDLAPHQLKAVPSADGKQVTYNKVNDDGSLTPLPNLTFSNDQDGVIRAAYMLDRTVTPATRYQNMVAADKQAAANAAKQKELELRERELTDVKIPNAETRAQLAEVRAQLAQVRASNSGKGDGVSREERLRYTTLFTDAGRRMQDASKTLNTMRQDRAFMRRATADPNSPEAQQLAEAQSQLTEHQQERELYRGLLATGSSGSSEKPSLGNATPRNGAKPAGKPGSSRDNPVKVTTQAQRDALPKGAYYTAPDGSLRIKQ